MKTIDAQNKKLGRIASEVAKSLLGKDSPDYETYRITGQEVLVTNVSKLDISEKKMKEKEYKRFTGYPSGLKHTPLEKLIENKGHEEVLRRAVKRMLPANRLRDDRMKMLKVTE